MGTAGERTSGACGISKPIIDEEFEIGRFLHLKFEIRNRKLDARAVPDPVQSPISDFEFKVQESSNFKFQI